MSTTLHLYFHVFLSKESNKLWTVKLEINENSSSNFTFRKALS